MLQQRSNDFYQCTQAKFQLFTMYQISPKWRYTWDDTFPVQEELSV